MKRKGQIVVVPADIDDVIARLHQIGSCVEEVATTDYPLGVTVGSGGEALVRAGKATNAYAETLARTIMGLADAIGTAKEEFQDADFRLAAQMMHADASESASSSVGEDTSSPVAPSPVASGADHGGGGSSW